MLFQKRALWGLLACLAASLGRCSNNCVQPTGIDDETAGALNSANFKPLDNVLGFYLNTITAWLISHETPIQFQIIQSGAGTFYAALAAYEPKALDPWARVDVMNGRRRCAGTTAEEAAFQLHRSVTIAYNTLYLVRYYTTPDLDDIMSGEMTRLGLDPTKCFDNISECDDPSTPWGLAFAGVNDSLTWFSKDGWNREGTLLQEFNARPYTDWRDQSEAYAPVNAPWDVVDQTRWTPLLEGNKKGFLFHQTHVVPHVGETGKTMYVPHKEACSRTLEDPQYDLEAELNLTLARSAELNDKTKMEIEFLDTKATSFPPMLGQWFHSMNISDYSFKHWYEDYALNSAIYEATLVSWRQKIAFDRIRPTTVAQQLGVGRTAMAFAGPGAGIREMPVDQWEPYIRTMPHAEFPSGSSCFCEVFREYLVLMSGKDEIDPPVVVEFPPGSSKVEPGVTPAQTITLTFSNWSKVSETCGQSRLDGGMHFTASVPAGVKICSGLATMVREAVLDLVDGKVPKHVTPLDSPLPPQKRCE